MDTNLNQLVRKARSCRRFRQNDPIPVEVVRSLVDLARLVPSGGNQQPLRYHLVTEAKNCALVFPHTKWAGALKDWGGPAEGERPTAYIVILAATGKSAPVDVGIAAQTIQLAATEQGYAACMLGAIDRPGILQSLGLPAEWEIQLLIALGRPGETIVLEALPQDGNTAYWRSADGVHHVPKRSLKQVLV